MLRFVHWQHEDVYGSQPAGQVVTDSGTVVAPMAEQNPIHLNDKHPVIFAVRLWAGMVTCDALNDVICSTPDACLVKDLGVSFDLTNSIVIEMRVRHQNEIGFHFRKGSIKPPSL